MEERFWLLDFDEEDHLIDLLKTITSGDPLTCIVDEDAGGIIAYVLGDEEYVDALCTALNDGNVV